MLTTRQRTLRRFWYPIVPIHLLTPDQPMPFRLMGEDIVLFLDPAGQPAALQDRCCHRTARLSKGWCERGQIVCGYHGWTYDGTGRLVRIPQLGPDATPPDYRVVAYRCQERYGYVWVALDEPLGPIFDIPEDRDPGFRRIFQFYETWNTSGLRLMENSFDNAHFSFVHRGTFGDPDAPRPERYGIEETEAGFVATTLVGVRNPPEAHAITGSTEPTTSRDMRNMWFLPFSRRMDMAYPSGIRHLIITMATPVDDGRIQVCQLLYRNDREEDCPTEALIAWDAAVIREDKDILESTNPDAVLDIERKLERNMMSDRPGLIMRRRLLELLRQHDEEEVTEVRPA